MTLWDVITSDALPAGAAVLALTQAREDAVSWEDVKGAVVPGPRGVLTWDRPAMIVPGIRLAARPVTMRFPPALNGESVTVQAVAFVDMSGPPVLLAVHTLLGPAVLSGESGPLVVTALMVVSGAQ